MLGVSDYAAGAPSQTQTSADAIRVQLTRLVLSRASTIRPAHASFSVMMSENTCEV